MNKLIVKLTARLILSKMLKHSSPFERILAQGIRLQLGIIGGEAFREYLEQFYSQVHGDVQQDEILFAKIRQQINQTNAAKIKILTTRDDAKPGTFKQRFTLWGRRFGILGHLGINADILKLTAGEQIPPHAHSRVVSGFYLLSGQVAIRHFHRIGEYKEGLIVKNTINTVLNPSNYTTNSKQHDDVHWLKGVAPMSFLFRINAVDIPAADDTANEVTHSRIYIDPTVEAQEDGVIRAPFIDQAKVQQLKFEV